MPVPDAAAPDLDPLLTHPIVAQPDPSLSHQRSGDAVARAILVLAEWLRIQRVTCRVRIALTFGSFRRFTFIGRISLPDHLVRITIADKQNKCASRSSLRIQRLLATIMSHKNMITACTWRGLGDNEIKERRHTDVRRLKYGRNNDITRIMMTLPTSFSPDVALITVASCDSTAATVPKLFLRCNTLCQKSRCQKFLDAFTSL